VVTLMLEYRPQLLIRDSFNEPTADRDAGSQDAVGEGEPLGRIDENHAPTQPDL
jgi:hypothetical protein